MPTVTQPETPRRILWLAVAEGRGHLMRAHLMRQRHPEIDVVTTSDAGVRFLASMGTPSRVVTRGFTMRYDAAQNLRRARTAGEALSYLLASYPKDIRDLAALATGYDLVFNDFHLMLLCAPWTHADLSPKLVHVHGEHLWGAISRPFAGTPWAWVDRALTAPLEALRARSHARIIHDPRAPLDRASRHEHTWRLPPLIARHTRSHEEVRQALGVRRGDALVTCYLNPYVRDPEVARAVEEACHGLGATLYGVSESFSDRPRWRAQDPAFVDKVAASNALISAPGMGAVGLTRTLGRPFLMLLSDQPEQRANARDLLSLPSRPPIQTADMGAPLHRALGALLAHPFRPARPSCATDLWTQTLEALS